MSTVRYRTITPMGLTTPPPDFSVIVPIASGRAPLVLASLDGLDTRAVRCEVLTQTGPNPSRNRNESIARARAAILAFTDDDCLVAPDWLANAAAFFEAHPDYDAVGGPQLNATSEGLVGRAAGHALASWFGTYRLCRRWKRARPGLAATQYDLTSANLFLTRRAFERWGPFDERLWPNEETALLRRIERAGGRIAYDPGIVVFHKRRDTLAALARQCFGYGSGRARQWRFEGAPLPGLAQAVPALFLVYLLALPLLATLSPAAFVPLAAYATLAVVASFATAMARTDPAAGLVMPFVFPAIHLGYGSGLLVESIRLAMTARRPARARALSAADTAVPT